MNVARPATQGAHYHADFIYLLPHLSLKTGARRLLKSYLGLRQLACRPAYFIPRLRKQVNNVRMVVSLLWRTLGNIHGLVQEWPLLKHQLYLPLPVLG